MVAGHSSSKTDQHSNEENKKTDPMEKVLEFVAPKTFGKLHYVAVVVWVLIGGTLLIILADMENSEPRLDFRCGAKTKNIELVRGRCFDEYEKQHNKFGFPIYAFVLINFVIILVVCASYSQLVRHTVDKLPRSIQNADPEISPLDQENPSPTGYELFIAYCSQLATRIVLGVLFIILQTQLLYPLKFSSNFTCYVRDGTNQPLSSLDATPNSTLYECHNLRAAKKRFWMDALLWVNIIFVAGILIETIYILSRACMKRDFMQNSKFRRAHLVGRSGQESKFALFIEETKERIKKHTSQPFELQPLYSGNPSEETAVRHLTLDQIYTNLVLIPNRDTYNFAENREEQLKVYPRSREETSHPISPEDLLNEENKKVVVVGRPGIGKTFFCTKLLRDWASSAETQFIAAFFVKFRQFNSAGDLSLRELLIKSEYFPTDHLDDEVWNHLLNNSEDVLILFDGFDEFKHNENMDEPPPFPRSIDAKMPLQTIYQWLVTGELLKNASVLTTTRPTAYSIIEHLPYDKRFEVLGFSSEQIEDYVYEFARDNREAGETLWRHISSNMNLLSLCYVPVNSFIICSSLLKLLQFDNSAGVTLPSKLTGIYKIAVRVFYYKHTREVPKRYLTCEHFQSDDLPDEVLENFKKLERVAFDGIKEGKLILGRKEVHGIEDSALFHRLPDRPLKHEPLRCEKQFCFIHLTMQEFFAARYLINNMGETELRNFVSENIKDGKWQLVFQFMAGFMNDKENLPSEIFTGLLPVRTKEKESAHYNEEWTMNEEKTKVTHWPTKEERKFAVTLLKCINETGKMTTEVQSKLQQSNFNCVDFNKCHLTAVDCSSLVNVMENVREISHLDLYGNNMGPLGCFEICKLLKCKKSQLSWLNFTGNQLKDEGAKYLADTITNYNCQLRTLDLRDNNITDTGAQHLAKAITNKICQLHTLNLSYNNITDTGAQHLAEAITNNNCQLHTLNLSDNNITDTGAQHLAEAITNKNCQLHTFNLSYNNITDTGAQHLAQAITNNNCQLRTLTLSDDSITDTGAQHLAGAITNNNCQLHTLNLSRNIITDTGAQHLAEAITNNKCQLHTLNLSHNNITETGAQHLAEAITNNNYQLRTLNLRHNNITDTGTQHLAEAITNNNCQLHTLNLSTNNITDTGAQHLAEAITNNNCQLCTLNISFNNITDTGAQHLADAVNCQLSNNNCQLRTLELSYNSNIRAPGKLVLNLASNSQSKCKLII